MEEPGPPTSAPCLGQADREQCVLVVAQRGAADGHAQQVEEDLRLVAPRLGVAAGTDDFRAAAGLSL
jgi:hypothetical protein